MRTIHRQIVSAMIFSKDGLLFQGKKYPKDGGVYNDCWHIPGGGLDDGEDLVQGLIREVREETGIDISNLPIQLIDDQGTGASEKTLKDTEETVWCEMKFNVYRVDLNQNADDIKVRLDDDLAQYQWTAIDDLKDLKLTPPSIELFSRLGYINTK